MEVGKRGEERTAEVEVHVERSQGFVRVVDIARHVSWNIRSIIWSGSGR